MDIAFADEKDNLLVIYLDDITVFSQSDEDHVAHLLRIFRKCIKFGISLNPKNSFFAMKEGKPMGHIISQECISIDLNRVEAISKIKLPRNNMEVPPFWER